MSAQGPAVELRYRLPAAPLRPYVSAYHVVEIQADAERPVEDLFYPGWTNLRFTLAGPGWTAQLGAPGFEPVPSAALFGVTSRAARVRATWGRLVGAGITPLGWVRLFGADAARFADRISPLETLVGDAEALLARLRACDEDAALAGALDAYFADRLARSGEPRPVLLAVHQLLNDPETARVEDIAEALGLSARQVARIAQAVFGLTPKLLLRRQRFTRTLMALREAGDGPKVGRLDPRYHDHSHFLRDCHRFLGMPLSEFLTRPRPILEASTRARIALLGVGAQSLHPPG